MASKGADSFSPHVVERAIESLGWSGEVRWACMFLDRLRGFGLPELDNEGDGPYVLVFPHCGSVHACGMRFNLDIAFADGDGGIVKHVENVGGGV